ncbi:aminotransferase-like domain-containing protein [Cupriavidus basilensis]|uniref:aminotransferase-like domain-containing protein n=1 Tax=Cupriavidus basilensis TaxID=68895 RepID=UPI0007509DDC|nr:PLP-dependent aminotransferase family protein [Cupriavidus basilensis]
MNASARQKPAAVAGPEAEPVAEPTAGSADQPAAAARPVGAVRTTLYARLAAELKQQILEGVFVAGQKLPSVRALSRSKQLSISTVQEAYRQLEDEQWVVVRSQSGCYVAPRLPEIARPEPVPGGGAVTRYLASSGPASALAYREDLIPFGAAIPDASFFPCERLATGIANLLRRKPALVGNYNFAPGSLELRQQVARRVVEWGASVDPRRVVITNGAVEAIQLCLRAVTKPGDTVAVEAPAYYGFLQTLQMLGLRALPVVGANRDGMDVDALARAAEGGKIAAVLLSTTVSNPSGATMPLARKRQLVELANRCRIPVIEDATFADLHFAGDCHAAQGFDESGLVMLCASLTKTIAPGMRVGWVDGGRFSEQIAFLKRVSSVGQPQVLELALAEYLASGGMARRLRRTRRAMQAQVYRMAENVARVFPEGTSFALPSGGFLLWVELPGEVDTLALQERAVGLGVGVAPGILFSPHGDYGHCIRMNCGVPDSPKAREGLLRLGELAGRMAGPR